MKVAVMAVAAAAGVQGMILDGEVSLFREWKSKHGKVYPSDDHELAKFETFKSNAMYIMEHNLNKEEHGFTLALNQFADMTSAEYSAFLLQSGDKPSHGASAYLSHNLSIPDSVDWSTQGYVTPVKNQGQCGSCWAFSAVGSLEGQFYKKNNVLVSFSEQELVDCSSSEGNMGCNGGLMDNGFKWLETQAPKGLCTEASYAYTDHDGQCHKDTCVGPTMATDGTDAAANVSGFTDIKQGDEGDLTNAIATVGPIAVAIDASHMSFQFYSRGVYHERACSSTRLDHGVLAVGYGVEGKSDYYKVKNSWGTGWGMKGYINMSRNRKNNCGIATSASYPIMAAN